MIDTNQVKKEMIKPGRSSSKRGGENQTKLMLQLIRAEEVKKEFERKNEPFPCGFCQTVFKGK